MEGLTDQELMQEAMKESAQMMNMLTNISAKYNMSQKTMSALTNLVSQDAGTLNAIYKDIKDETGQLITPTVQYTAVLAAVGNAAEEAGFSGEAAMNVLSDAIKDPIKHAKLLGSAINGSIAEQTVAAGERASEFVKRMEDMTPAGQIQFAKSLGYTREQLEGLAASHQALKDEYGDITSQKVMLKLQKDLEDEQKAEAERAQATQDAYNKLKQAADSFAIVLAGLIGPLTEFVELIAAFVQSPVGKAIVFITGGLVALKAAMLGVAFASGTITSAVTGTVGTLGKFKDMLPPLKKEGQYFPTFAKIFSKGSEDVSKSSKGLRDRFTDMIGGLRKNSKEGDGIFKGISKRWSEWVGGFGKKGTKAFEEVREANKAAENSGVDKLPKTMKSFTEGLERLGGVKWGAILRAAGLVALVGIALAVGVGAIGLAANALPEDKALELVATLGAIMLAMVILNAVAPLIPIALPAAIALALVGAALAVGLVLIGLALHAFPEEAPEILLALSAAMLSLAALALTIPLAMVAVVGMIAVFGGMAVAFGILALVGGVALMNSVAESLTAIGSSMSNLDPNAGSNLSALADGLIDFANAFSLGGLFGPDAEDVTANAIVLANAMTLFVAPLTALASISGEIGTTFDNITSGLKKFTNVLKADAGFMTDFKDKAKDLATAMDILAPSMANITGVDAAAADDAAKATAAVVVEEIKGKVGVDIENQSADNKEMLAILKSIDTKLDNVGTDDELVKEAKKSNTLLDGISREMMFNAGTGNTSSNSNYAL
jgi:hypothetical protein